MAAPAERRKFGRSWRDFWGLARPFWVSEEKWKAGGLLAVVIALTLGGVYSSVLFNFWNQQFFDALQKGDRPAVTRLVIRFFPLMAAAILVAVYQQYLRQLLQIRWRRWLTEHLLGRWMSNRTFYFWQLLPNAADNPDQRIAEDIDYFIKESLSLSLTVLQEVVTVFSFIAILWASGPIMVWAAILYAIAGSWITHLIGKPLTPLNFEQQKFEANFRFGLARLRENAESVALSDGGSSELRGLTSRFLDVFANTRRMMNKQKQLTFFTTFFANISQIFPLAMNAPRMLAGELKLGGLIQIASAFTRVETALSFLVKSYAQIAHWRSVVQRLSTFAVSLDRAAGLERSAREVTSAGTTDSLAIRGLGLRLPDGSKLVEKLDWDVPRGSFAMISGPSGCGKSTLIRAATGSWPFTSGRIELPGGMRGMVLPQKPYLPMDRLDAVLAYPLEATGARESWPELLELCRLTHLTPRLAESANWALILSPGEQQRVAFFRAFLHRPDWIFLDEATSALDEVTQGNLYGALRSRLPGVTVISVAHRESLRQLHDLHFNF